MTAKNILIFVLFFRLEFIFCVDPAECFKFQPQEPQEDENTQTFKFRLVNTCNSTDYSAVERMTVTIQGAGSAETICNIIRVNVNGKCEPIDNCTCDGSYDYVVTRRLNDEIRQAEEKLELNANVFIKGRNDGPIRVHLRQRTNDKTTTRSTTSVFEPRRSAELTTHPAVDEKEKETEERLATSTESSEEETKAMQGVDELSDSSKSFLKTPTFSFIILGVIAAIFVFISIGLLVALKLKGTTPMSAIRALRRSGAYDEAYELRRPAVPVQAAYIQVNRDSMPGSEPFYSVIKDQDVASKPKTDDGYIPMDKGGLRVIAASSSSPPLPPPPLSPPPPPPVAEHAVHFAPLYHNC